jgi:hypothetical protein
MSTASYQASYRAANREKIAARDAAYKAAHPEKWAASQAAYQATWYEAHREEKATSNAAYHAAHREEVAATNATYYAAHREEIAAKKAAYYAVHREESAAYRAAYAKANPEKVNAACALRRARKRGNSIGSPRPDFKAILAEFGMVCHICGLEILGEVDLHMDHVIPLAKGGPHSAENLRPSHATCNIRKGSKLLAA